MIHLVEYIVITHAVWWLLILYRDVLYWISYAKFVYAGHLDEMDWTCQHQHTPALLRLYWIQFNDFIESAPTLETDFSPLWITCPAVLWWDVILINFNCVGVIQLEGLFPTAGDICSGVCCAGGDYQHCSVKTTRLICGK